MLFEISSGKGRKLSKTNDLKGKMTLNFFNDYPEWEGAVENGCPVLS